MNENINTNAIPEEAMNEYSLSAAPAAPAVPAAMVETDDDGASMILDLTTRRTSYCSLTAQTEEDKAVLFNAMNAPDQRLKEHINEVIRLKDIFVEVVYCTNEETGVVSPAPRIVLIDDGGVSYQCVSKGIFGAVKKLFAVFLACGVETLEPDAEPVVCRHGRDLRYHIRIAPGHLANQRRDIRIRSADGKRGKHRIRNRRRKTQEV